ncbi:MAG: GIY-YIG nuclease family protein [Deltaproteobacteria bacterium]|nr:GIY-YIG nuclease family protein [Deltaproteobacteria bacterium]
MKRQQRGPYNNTDLKIPAKPGSYAIVFLSKGRGLVRIGRLGTLELQKGYYVYLGSAFGPGGLRARVTRHLSGPRIKHWHIDYLSGIVTPCEVWYTPDTIRREHHWAGVMARCQGVSIPLRGFGSSDCHCEAHLCRFDRPPDVRSFGRSLRLPSHDHYPAPAHKIHRLHLTGPLT